MHSLLVWQMLDGVLKSGRSRQEQWQPTAHAVITARLPVVVVPPSMQVKMACLVHSV